MNNTANRQAHKSHLWIILLTILALAAVYLVEMFTARRPPAEAASTLEPAFSLPGGYYDQDIELEISAPAPDVDVVFTVDGSVPTRTLGTKYTHPIRLSAATPAVTVIRARAILPGGEFGPVASVSYFVGLPATLPLISLIVEPDDLWRSARGIYANSDARGEAWERPVDVTYVDTDRRAGFHVLAGVRIHGRGSRDFDKKSLRLYFRQEYGASRLEYPLFASAGSEVRFFKRLVLHNGGQDHPVSHWWAWTLIRNQLTASLAFLLDGYATHSRPALLFINGEPWGIYQIRERVDGYFLADHYGVESAEFLESPGAPGQRAISTGDYGNGSGSGNENWDHLLQFVAAHDLADPANYAYVQSQVDVANLIDYSILQIYAANIDWPFHNVRRFRPRVQGGRWHWLFWDSDRGFDASRIDLNLMQRVMDCDDPETGGGDALLLRKLLENPVFRQQFLSRTADLLNTTLAPPSVIAHIDALAAELEPDIAYETTRWSSTTNWASSVQGLRDFAHLRPDFVRQHIVEGFNLNGTAQLTFNPPASGSGSVAVNGALAPELPWQGVYFQGVPVQIIAVPMPGHRFAGWDPPHLPQTPVITVMVQAQANVTQTLTPRFEPASDDAPQPGDVVFGPIQENWFELQVARPGGVDLRGWRLTDNDTKTATDEGSLIFTDNLAFARVPRGTTILVILASPLIGGTEGGVQDDLNTWDRQMVVYAGNGNLDTNTDPGFNLGPNDNLVLLAPGPTKTFGDDQGIAFVTLPGPVSGRTSAVTPASFGVLADGVLPAGQ